MAWLARSIANTLKLDEEDEDDGKPPRSTSDESDPNQSPSQSVSESQSPRGVKEDISELTKTLRSQFWGVASFLSQSSSSPPDHIPHHAEESDEEDLISGIKNDFAEFGGRFKTGISKISGNLPVSELTKMASNFLQMGSEGSVDPNVIGVTDELVAFVKDLALNPEIWLDFTLPNDDDNGDDFEMTDDQHEHALSMERLVPSLASLRIELCPEYMSENCFWRIYFVLLHPKLNRPDALLLSTPQVVESRAMLSPELQESNIAPIEAESFEATVAVVEPLIVPYNPSPEPSIVRTVNQNLSPDSETDKHLSDRKDIQVVDKTVIEERNTSSDSLSRFINVQVEDDEDADDWLNDEETSGSVSATTMEGGAISTKHPIGEDEEDVSFSDLEEDEGDMPVSYKKISSKREQESNDLLDIRYDP